MGLWGSNRRLVRIPPLCQQESRRAALDSATIFQHRCGCPLSLAVGDRGSNPDSAPEVVPPHPQNISSKFAAYFAETRTLEP